MYVAGDDVRLDANFVYTLQYMNALKIDTVLRCQAGNCPHFTEHDPIGVRYEPGAGHF